MPTNETSLTASEVGAEELKPNRMFDDEDGNKFDPSNPRASFNRMLTNHKVDLVGEALRCMSGYIYDRAQGLMTDVLLL